MANPFDQFDQPAGNPFDQFDSSGVQSSADASSDKPAQGGIDWRKLYAISNPLAAPFAIPAVSDFHKIADAGVVSGAGSALAGVERMVSDQWHNLKDQFSPIGALLESAKAPGPAIAKDAALTSAMDELRASVRPDGTSAVSSALLSAGEAIKSTASPELLQAMENSRFEGDALSPSTWGVSDDASLLGFAGNLTETGGQMLPIVGAGMVNPAAGAAVAAGQSAEGAYKEAADYLKNLPVEQFSEIPRFKELVAEGVPIENAHQIVIDEAGSGAMYPAAAVGSLSGPILGGTVTRPLAAILEKRFGQGFLSRLYGNLAEVPLEGAQEGFESAAGRAGANTASGDDRSLTEGTFGDVVMGGLAAAPAAVSHSIGQIAAESSEDRIRKLADVVLGDREVTPESNAVEAGRNAAAAIFGDAGISNDTGQPIPDPRIIDFTQAVDPETGLPPIGVQPEVMGDLDAMVPSEPEAAPDPVRPAVEPVAQPAQETQGKSIPGLSEPIRSGTRVFYPGDVDAMRAKLDAAGLDAGMRRNNEDGTPAGLYFPARMQAEVDAVLRRKPSEDSVEAPTNNATPERIAEVPIASLTLSDDVPQFKSGAREDGVVEPLGGKFDRRGTGPIQVWRRNDGRMEVISGRHRLDLARRSGETTIPAQVYDEAQGFDARQAASLDAELNIRDGQGKVKDYVQYFTQPAFDGPEGRQAADARGLLARATGKRAYSIASQGSSELIAAHSADRVTDEAAVQIAQAAPQNAPLQALGMKLVQEGKSIGIAANTMRAVRSMQGDRPQTSGDMFGFDDSAIQDAVKIAGVASRRQREIGERLAAITGAAKRPDIARREGVDVRDPQALPARIAQLRAEKAEWDDWATDPAKVDEIRAELGMEPQPEFARAEDPAEFVDDVTAPMFSRGLRPRSEMESAPVGAWIDGGNVPGIGPTAFQVRDVPLDKISPVELDSVGDVGPEKRSDVGRYTEAMRRGEQFPNARGYELENGKIKLVDGHRRLLAAKAAGKTSLRIAVNPLDDSARSAMFSRRTGGASGDMFGGATIEDTNRASPRSRMPETADLFGGPSMQERVGAAERARDAARNSGDGKRADTGDGGLFDGPRPEQAILRSQRKQEDDYRGLHRAPSRESGSPLSDLSNTYPDDVYGKNAAQYYGHHGGGHPMDRASVRIIQSYKNEPDAPVKIYRAVPTDAGAEINAGDWVTINKDYAKEHGESQFGDGYKIIEKSVKAKDIYTNGDSIHEWGYDPEVSSVLKSKRPDAKGLEVDENIELTPEEMAAFNRQVDNRQRQPENRANDAQRLPADTGLVRRPADGTTAPERAGMVSARGNRDSQSSARQVSPAADAKPDLTGQPPKFGQWFRQSKMKDAKARPMEFHHATDADFDTFDAGKRGSSTGFAPTGLGNWFSQDAGAIKGYGSKVLSGHLRLENPKVMDSHELPDLESKADYEALAKKYKVEGYDGLYFPDSKQAVAFDSVQFKENRNSGEYSESPNIYRSQHADNQSETPQAKDAKDSKDAGKLKETSNTASEPKRLFIPEVKAAKESPEQVTTKKARPEELIEARKRRGNLRQLLDCLNA